MANVQLPSIGITPGDIDNANLPQLQKIVKGLLNTTAILTEELTYLLNNLDTRNVNEIDGDILVTGTVTAGKIAAGAITAEKIDVDELSAISANFGKMTSGEIYGTYIATREFGYPRAEMSNTSNLFGAYSSSSNYITMNSVGTSGTPQMIVSGPLAIMSLLMLGSTVYQSVTGGNLSLSADEIRIIPNDFRGIKVSAFSDIVDESSGKSLQQVLDEKQDKTL